VAIVKDGTIVVAKGYGVRKLGDPTPVDEHTMFGIGSNTKAFTTAALAGGYHLAWLVGAGTFVITLVLTIALLRPRTSVEIEIAMDEGEAVA